MKFSTKDKSAPVRLCCGQRHYGTVCHDGKVLCCICFLRVSQSDLHVLEDDKKEDVCKSCYEKEQNSRISIKKCSN